MSIFSKQKAANISIPEGSTLCLTGADLLNNVNSIVNDIKNLISVTPEDYKNLYLEVFNRLAAFCQQMPDKKAGETGSLLSRQLLLCKSSLQLRRQLLLPEGAGAETIAREEPLWTYAFFTASLLAGLENIQYDRTISLYNREGKSQGIWHPISGSLYFPQETYAMTWKPLSLILNSAPLKAALASQLVPAKALHWLSLNPGLFELWWKYVVMQDPHTIFSHIIQEAAAFLRINFCFEDKNPITDNVDLSKQPENIYACDQEKIRQNAVEENENALMSVSMLLSYLEEQQNEAQNNIFWVRLAEGLLIEKKVLNNFIDENPDWENSQEFIEENKPFLLEEEGCFLLQYRPSAFEDRRILEGIVIKPENLTPFWQQQTINTEFELSIKL